MITYESAINKIAERVVDLKQESRNISLQRRNQVVDMYGTEFTRQGANGKPASFYISISPDLIYFERFEFKIIIEGFEIPIANDGISSSVVIVNPRSLAIDHVELETNAVGITVNSQQVTTVPSSHAHTLTPSNHHHDISSHAHSISPNPHDHETIPHGHSIIAGISSFNVETDEFKIIIEGIDMTPYFKAILPDESKLRWLDGAGIFPTAGLKNFDVLEAVAYMDQELREKILKPGYKRIDIVGNGVFNATLVNYLKYSHVNR